MRKEQELQKLHIPMSYTDFSKVDSKDIEQQTGGTHADEIETSEMLFIKPEVVNMSVAKKDFDDKPGALKPTPPKPGSKDAYSPTGAWGDPTLATKAKGKIIVARSCELISKAILSNIFFLYIISYLANRRKEVEVSASQSAGMVNLKTEV